MAELEARLRQLKAVNPNFPVVIKGDEKISYKSVIEVLDLLQRLGYHPVRPGHAEAREVIAKEAKAMTQGKKKSYQSALVTALVVLVLVSSGDTSSTSSARTRAAAGRSSWPRSTS